MFLVQERLNVFVVDWGAGSWQLPVFSLLEADGVAATVTAFIRNLTRTYGLRHRDLHVIGESLTSRET